jgi:hypothetical protein
MSLNDYEDKELVCKDCEQTFIYTKRDQEFFHQLVEDGKMPADFAEPKRCLTCRKKRREAKAQRGY